ncbi:unnamed protein product [Darwinula stevensoni]|uniref:SANT and BTB domain-containing protein n=1 Tax=Darwinula stevensoni TaxID=69355 RepID=A0A7R9FT19_9CRUS|nr:unnamed protein product [Darwinula stevensoni]CAG0903734.1 unnamed protein product [Darwinula stevensoni]
MAEERRETDGRNPVHPLQLLMEERLLDSIIPFAANQALLEGTAKGGRNPPEQGKATPPTEEEALPVPARPLDPREGKEVSLQVVDDGKTTTKHYRIPSHLLLRHMEYFTSLSTGQNLEEVDITVHCDVSIFDWLMEWVRRDPDDPNAGPKFDASRVIPILISADFLGMTGLVDEGLKYLKENLHRVIPHTPRFSILGEKLLARLGNLFHHGEVEDLHDPKDRIRSRLFGKLILQLFQLEPSQQHGHYASAANLFRWASVHSWRLVYWFLWGAVHFLECTRCGCAFPAQQMGWCSYHPEMPEYPPVDHGSHAPAGRFPCCEQEVFRFDPMPGFLASFTRGRFLVSDALSYEGSIDSGSSWKSGAWGNSPNPLIRPCLHAVHVQAMQPDELKGTLRTTKRRKIFPHVAFEPEHPAHNRRKKRSALEKDSIPNPPQSTQHRGCHRTDHSVRLVYGDKSKQEQMLRTYDEVMSYRVCVCISPPATPPVAPPCPRARVTPPWLQRVVSPRAVQERTLAPIRDLLGSPPTEEPEPRVVHEASRQSSTDTGSTDSSSGSSTDSEGESPRRDREREKEREGDEDHSPPECLTSVTVKKRPSIPDTQYDRLLGRLWMKRWSTLHSTRHNQDNQRDFETHLMELLVRHQRGRGARGDGEEGEPGGAFVRIEREWNAMHRQVQHRANVRSLLKTRVRTAMGVLIESKKNH